MNTPTPLLEKKNEMKRYSATYRPLSVDENRPNNVSRPPGRGNASWRFSIKPGFMFVVRRDDER
jgi:hypothetical protein